MKPIHGVITAMVTPFLEDEVDFTSLGQLIRQQLDAGIEGLVVNGTTAESPTLSSKEQQKLFSFVKSEVSGAVPLIFGTGTNSTATTIETTQKAFEIGCDAALVVVPYYNKPPQRGLVEHFRSVADAASGPIIVYNVPGRTVAELEVPALIELASHPKIVGIKEASGDLKYLEKGKSEVPEDFIWLSGDDESCVDFCFRGGHGVISVLSHIIPAELKDLCARARRKDAQAVKDFKKYLKLTKLLFVEANPIPVKKAMQLLGVIQTDEMRLPLMPLAEELSAQLQQEMKQLGVAK